ncbi:MAG: hypothetical protein L7W43_04735, partial [Rubripirellula sp.]|nr:hypothetical protein [Rubripirellula sp.]
MDTDLLSQTFSPVRFYLRTSRYFSMFVFFGIHAVFATASDPNEGRSTKIHPTSEFLRSFCTDCHGNGTEEGERNFDAFELPIKTVGQLITADEIIDQLTLRLMPPPDAAQPTN